ncbi:MAG TPA: alpha/beta hydrolase [Microbacterium sp.]|nr:alpha/beta hydrolase [Microbacterium sp.]
MGEDAESTRPPIAFRHDGSTLIAEESGHGDRVFLLVHGIGMGRNVFDALAGLLGEHGRVVAVDLPGYGQAPEPPRTPTMERLGDLIAAFIRAKAFESVVLVGHSMGAQVVIEAVARHPGIAERVVLIGPTVNDRERSARVQLRRLAQDLIIESPKVVAIGARAYARAGPNLRSKMRAMIVHEPEHSLPLVTAETLVIRGGDDLVVPRHWCERVVSLLPDGRLEVVRDHGHETMIRDARPTARLILAFVEGDGDGPDHRRSTATHRSDPDTHAAN